VTVRWKTAWITGASTGIGREMALLLAGQGVRVAASARNADKLADLAKDQPGIVPIPLDVTDRAAVARAYDVVRAQLGAVDLAILNAGIWGPMGAAYYRASRIEHSMAVNFGGIVNALEPLLADMIAIRAGHVALVASVAGYRGLPQALAYAPSKAAVISLAEVLKLELAPHKVKVSLINPGFVETPMTAVNTFPMPFKLTASDAARRIIKGLETSRFEIASLAARRWIEATAVTAIRGLFSHGPQVHVEEMTAQRNAAAIAKTCWMLTRLADRQLPKRLASRRKASILRS
jgi:short-subunit dehydrogenase